MARANCIKTKGTEKREGGEVAKETEAGTSQECHFHQRGGRPSLEQLHRQPAQAVSRECPCTRSKCWDLSPNAASSGMNQVPISPAPPVLFSL